MPLIQFAERAGSNFHFLIDLSGNGCLTNTTLTDMVRYVLSFNVPEEKLSTAQKIIKQYFDELNKSGPGGMRSFCYCSEENSNSFVQINTYRKETVANKDLRTGYTISFMKELEIVCNQQLSFNKMATFDAFESIY